VLSEVFELMYNPRVRWSVLAVGLIACAHPRPSSGDDTTDANGHRDSGGGADALHQDANMGSGGDGGGSGSGQHDAGMTNVITGGPCLSGMPGQTGYRIRWQNGGGTATPVYEVNGLPDHSRDHTGAYGYQIGFTASYVDQFLGPGGLQLDGSDFVDLELTTAGVSSISHATLSIYGRSYNTTTSGSFNWQTFVGTGASPTNLVSNAAPYQWYSADMTTELAPNDASTLIRIKAGPSSGALVVNRIELCITGS
jgi:hypothetical protein